MMNSLRIVLTDDYLFAVEETVDGGRNWDEVAAFHYRENANHYINQVILGRQRANLFVLTLLRRAVAVMNWRPRN